jgi:hypothetical protein
MSDAALKDYERARKDQLTRNEARRIRTRVNEARATSHDAGVRWPFELLQNALDAGPLEGNDDVTISLSCNGNRMVFEHNGAPFSLQDLAALLSGGSSKEFESEETTGRFGTGFLVTHVLAEQTHVAGLLRAGDGLEEFALVLDRAGEEDSIIDNIRRCDEAILNAQPLKNCDGRTSARFEYIADDQSALTIGVNTFGQALPYLFASCSHLGVVTVRGSNGSTQVWSPVSRTERSFGGALLVDRTLEVRDGQGCEPLIYRCIRVSMGDHAENSAIVVLHQRGPHWTCLIPEPELPRIFCRFPLRSTHWLSANVILDGRFDVDQERRTVLLNERTKGLLSDALRAIPAAVEFAMVEGCADAHLLARVGPLRPTFSDGISDRAWWSAELSAVARRLAAMPLVETRNGRGPAAGDSSADWCADFPIPRLFLSDSSDETTLGQIWPLLDEAEDLYPPILPLVKDWSETAKDWTALGVDLEKVTLEVLARHVKGEATCLTALKVRCDQLEWLVRFIDVVGECWTFRKGVDPRLLQGLLPDQMGHLRSPSDLSRDAGIPEDLKDIAEALGIRIHSRLLDRTLVDTAARLGLSNCAGAIAKAVPNVVTEEVLIGECLRVLDQKLEDGKRITPDNHYLLVGSIRLMAYLWGSKGTGAVDLVRKLPFAALNGLIVRWTREKRLMSPVPNWHEAARPFWNAYPSHRVLDPIYCGVEGQNIPDLVAALVAWEIAISDPISKDAPAELKDRRLAALADGGQETQGITVTGQQFSQIALLQPDVLNHCQEDEEARALLGLVLRYVAPSDPSWLERRMVRGRRGGQDFDLSVRGALWLADLRSKAWVPVKGEDGKTSRVEANEVSIRRLLDPEWLAGNDAAINLLIECFGFDNLDLRLLGASPDPAVRQQLRDGLAKLLETAGSNPDTYTNLARELEERQAKTKLVEHCRNLGLAVQAAVGEALEHYGLRVKLVDRGFDFEVTLETGDIADGSLRFEVDRFLVEVKATTTGEARLTPLQAATAGAEKERYVLCVVDLRSISADRLGRGWTRVDIDALARMVPGIGKAVGETWGLVEWARTEQVAIRNEKALRYGVPPDLWETGVSISAWVLQIAAELTGDQSPE